MVKCRCNRLLHYLCSFCFPRMKTHSRDVWEHFRGCFSEVIRKLCSGTKLAIYSFWSDRDHFLSLFCFTREVCDTWQSFVSFLSLHMIIPFCRTLDIVNCSRCHWKVGTSCISDRTPNHFLHWFSEAMPARLVDTSTYIFSFMTGFQTVRRSRGDWIVNYKNLHQFQNIISMTSNLITTRLYLPIGSNQILRHHLCMHNSK